VPEFDDTMTTPPAPTHSRAPVILITGASQRIGRTLALDFGRRGWSVGVHYRASRDPALALVAELRTLGVRAAALAGDLADHTQVAALIPACMAQLGPPDCLINNASEFRFDELDHMTAADWTRHMDVNLRAPVFLAQAFAAGLPAGKTGNIINIIDQRVWRPTPEFFSYTLSKQGLWDATKLMAQALAPRIRVNGIGPGPVLKSIHQSDADFAHEAATTPLQRATSPDEIAAAVRFILDAPAMTGQMIALDGGQHLSWRPDVTSSHLSSQQISSQQTARQKV
jgi:NAD(P)-dependent dehydrogenase (short-subunit alcohol dehydrogenase family)